MRAYRVLLTFVMLLACADSVRATSGGLQPFYVRPWGAILLGVFLTASLFYDETNVARAAKSASFQKSSSISAVHEAHINKTTDARTFAQSGNQKQPRAGQMNALSLYYSSFGGESNCEFCLQKARWIASFVNASALYVPTCYKTHHTSGDVNLFDLYDEAKDGHCCDDGGGGLSSDSDKQTPHTNRFEIKPFDPHAELGTHALNGMPCMEVLPGRCAFELEEIKLSKEKSCVRNRLRYFFDFKLFVKPLVRIFCVFYNPAHSAVRWTGTFTDLNAIETLGERVYFAGVFDFQPSSVLSLPGGRDVPRIPEFGFCAAPTFNAQVAAEAGDKILQWKDARREETTCVHWRQEDFRLKGMEFVNNVTSASHSIARYAKKFKTNTVLLLTNDPQDDFEHARLAWLLGNLTHLKLRTLTTHHDVKNAPKSIAIDKAACVEMEGFVGTAMSSFSESIIVMRDARRGRTPLACVKEYARDGERGTETDKDVLL